MKTVDPFHLHHGHTFRKTTSAQDLAPLRGLALEVLHGLG